ncbi:MAG: glutamine--tRNA ligase/YqeY domain fusion protein [Candidatus Oxydemutatoraceae bacterium WSBS_2016_MAG_OTU14]
MSNTTEPIHFIEKIIEADLAAPVGCQQVITRFPPEPNGFLHIGHAKAICLNFEIAQKYNGLCHLRFDDTNPLKESQAYAEAIMRDIQWLGFSWHRLCYASDYFPQLYEYAKKLIRQNQAFVCDLNPDQIREQRGTLTQAGIESPCRHRSIEENLHLFEQMYRGKFAQGQYVLRAKIDMASPNINMRDPVIYRILHAEHHRVGNRWCIYPTYDFTHCLSDAIEGITHSLCTLEFEDHRPLYDWFLEALDTHHPRQIEFARLQLEHTLTSKRKLQQLVTQNMVEGWSDPRLPTLAGLRQRGIPPAAIHQFCKCIGITKKDSWIDMKLLDDCVRDVLNETTARTMGVLNPLKVVIENYPDDEKENIEVSLHPQHPEQGKRSIAFNKTIYIEQDDFMEVPPEKFRRLSTGQRVKLRYAHIIECDEVIKDEGGNIQELRCHCLPQKDADGKKIKTNGIIHWISESDAVVVHARLYELLFTDKQPILEDNTEPTINPNSLQHVRHCMVHKHVLEDALEQSYQFERLGYFYVNRNDNTPSLYRIITLRDSK